MVDRVVSLSNTGTCCQDEQKAQHNLKVVEPDEKNSENGRTRGVGARMLALIFVQLCHGWVLFRDPN